METITRDMERRVMGLDLLMKEIGKMECFMVTEHTNIPREIGFMKEILKMGFLMVLEKKDGQKKEGLIGRICLSVIMLTANVME